MSAGLAKETVVEDRGQWITGSSSSAALPERAASTSATIFELAAHPAAVSEKPISARWVYGCLSFAGVSFLLLHLCDMNFCDPDMWHEMALFRETLIEGWVPAQDRFSYTPTLDRVIHHEWGSGAIFYAVANAFGAPGVMFLKYGLVAAVLYGCSLCARWRGAGAACFLTFAPAMALFSSYGFTTIRAQVFTLLMLTIMLCFLEIDRRGSRWWIACWLPLHVIWLNLHAGFVVGSGLMALHACEQIIRRRPFWHFVPVGMTLAILVLVNPYGTEYLPYLLHGLTMARPLIVEWNPLWRHDTRVFILFLVSLAPVAYAARQLGSQRLAGIVVLLATAFAAARHTRHLSLYCVVWTCYVPAMLQQTRLGALVEQIFARHGRFIAQCSMIASVACLFPVVMAAPWRLVIPSTNEHARQGLVCYPVGAVQYLHDSQFRGNLMTPFEVGGYVMWKLHPQAKVSLDGRYEVAYQDGLLEEHLSLYAAKPGWQNILSKYPTDAVLVPSLSRLATVMPSMEGWNRVYHDGVYEVYARPGFFLAATTLNCSPAHASIP